MNRKDFLTTCGSVTFAILAAACGKKSPADASETAPVSGACDDLSGLTEGDLQVRKSLSYVAVSPYSDQLCDNCQYWIAAREGAECGGCVTLRGPIQPKGYCSYWAPITVG